LIRPRLLLKWLLFLLVLAYVCHHGYRLWNQSDVRQRPLSAAGVGWLTVAGLIYTASWLPSVWFWRELMRALGGRVNFRDTARAYYCGHLGKYIPGKAMVLVIRAALVKDRGCSPLIAAVTASCETLIMMGTGVGFGAALGPLLFRDWVASRVSSVSLSPPLQSVIAMAVIVAVVAVSLPFVSKMLTWVAAKAVPDSSLVNAQEILIPAGLIGAGCGAFVISWALQGLSLGLIVHAVGEIPFDVSDLPMWTGAMALSTSLGFAVLFAPGGLGVREGILLGILNSQPGISPQTAVAVTVLSRVVSFLAELMISTVLFTTVRRRADDRSGRQASGESR
jgi:glycosyltransferase 2 family protein